jgi:hypothetical protein
VDYWATYERDGYINPTYTKRDYENKVKKGDLNFAFDTNYDIKCWYQEWARVVDLPHLGITNSNYYQIKYTVDYVYNTPYDWYESYTEKISAANTTFDMAISGLYPNYVFINSLCGYLVDKSIEISYTPFTGSNTGGIAGNIQALADKINVDFYQHVLNSGLEQTTGPTGIVMMDYAKSTPSSDVDGGYYLPGVIISNNFKGNLQTKPDGGTTGGGNTGGGTDEGEEEEG